MATRIALTNVQLIGDELAIVWNDGVESYLPLEALRRACPCAACGGEPDVLGYVTRPEVTYTAQSFVFQGCQVVGGYALQPAWGDGHGSGLYTFPYLRRLAGHPVEPHPAMTRTTKLSILAAVFFLCGAAAMLQHRFHQDRRSTPPSELYEVVRKQVHAFREADFASAYRQVSTSFQERMNMEAFSDLARTDYPGIARAERVEFGAVRFEGRHAIVPVYFFLQDGDVIPCMYSLVNEDRAWKIDGARVLKRWPAGRRLGGMRS